MNKCPKFFLDITSLNHPGRPKIFKIFVISYKKCMLKKFNFNKTLDDKMNKRFIDTKLFNFLFLTLLG